MNSWSRDRVLLTALGVSFLVHLSMVTVFRIVITFPRQEIEYYDLSLVEAAERPSVSAPLTGTLEAPSASDALSRLEGDGAASDDGDWPALPSVALPRLSFSELDLVRLSRTSLDTRSRYDGLFEEEPDDLWAQFGRRLSSVGELLRSGRRESLDGEAGPKRLFAGHPAPGFDTYIEWMTPPYDRQMLVMQKIDALWGKGPEALHEPLVMVVRVNAAGRVTFVQMPLEDPGGVLNSAAGSMFQNLFEPLENPDGGEQHATVIVQSGEIAISGETGR